MFFVIILTYIISMSATAPVTDSSTNNEQILYKTGVTDLASKVDKVNNFNQQIQVSK